MSTKSAKVVQVIEVTTNIGKGTEADPNRVVIELWSLDGNLLAVNDPCAIYPGSVASPHP